MLKQLAISSLLFAAVSAPSQVFAIDDRNTAPGLTYAGAPLGLHGADPVALVQSQKSSAGLAKHSAVHDGVAYYFASAANLAAFKQSPGRYAPQNGGFCTLGVAFGKKFDGDPRYAAVEGGRLYVFLNQDVYNEFNKDRAGTIARAAGNWRRIEPLAAATL